MRKNTLIILAAVTLLVAILAVIVTDFRALQQQKEKPLLFPALSSQLDKVASIEIKSDIDSISLSRHQNSWTIDEFAGYPALLEKVKATVIGVSELRIIAPKTADKARYDRLGVEGLGVAGSPSLYLTLKDSDDAVLADLIVGLPRSSRAAENSPGLYVRRPDDAQSYLVEGLLAISADKRDWFERLLFDIPMADIHSVSVSHSDGDTYTIAKSDPDQADFVLAPVPQGKKARSAVILNKLGSLLQGFHAEAVHKADAIPNTDNPIAVVVKTFAGLVAHIRFFNMSSAPMHLLSLPPMKRKTAAQRLHRRRKTAAQRLHRRLCSSAPMSSMINCQPGYLPYLNTNIIWQREDHLAY